MWFFYSACKEIKHDPKSYFLETTFDGNWTHYGRQLNNPKTEPSKRGFMVELEIRKSPSGLWGLFHGYHGLEKENEILFEAWNFKNKIVLMWQPLSCHCIYSWASKIFLYMRTMLSLNDKRYAIFHVTNNSYSVWGVFEYGRVFCVLSAVMYQNSSLKITLENSHNLLFFTLQAEKFWLSKLGIVCLYCNIKPTVSNIAISLYLVWIRTVYTPL